MLMRRLNRKPAKKIVSPNHYSHIERLAPPITLPPSTSNQKYCSPIEDQGDEGSCTGHACAGGVEFLQNKLLAEKISNQLIIEPAQFVPVSRAFIYANERIREGTLDQDSGASLDDGTAVVEQLGVCREALWAYSDDTMYTKPTQAAYDEAAKHKVLTAFQISNLYQMKHSLAQGFPFVFGIVCYDSFLSEQVAQTGIIPMPGANESPQGGHALLAVDYSDEKQAFLFRNSWGTSWGIGGYAWIPYTYLNNQQLAEDFWSFRYS
jgi:C1A family cysteine protease